MNNNTFDDSLPMQMPNSTQSKRRSLVLLQKKYSFTCKNIVTKPNLDEFSRELFEQYGVENRAEQYFKYVWQLTGFYPSNTFYFCCNLFCHLLTYLFIYPFTLCCVLMLLICCQ